jgi:hypothetical protein
VICPPDDMIATEFRAADSTSRMPAATSEVDSPQSHGCPPPASPPRINRASESERQTLYSDETVVSYEIYRFEGGTDDHVTFGTAINRWMNL